MTKLLVKHNPNHIDILMTPSGDRDFVGAGDGRYYEIGEDGKVLDDIWLALPNAPQHAFYITDNPVYRLHLRSSFHCPRHERKFNRTRFVADTPAELLIRHNLYEVEDEEGVYTDGGEYWKIVLEDGECA